MSKLSKSEVDYREGTELCHCGKVDLTPLTTSERAAPPAMLLARAMSRARTRPSSAVPLVALAD